MGKNAFARACAVPVTVEDLQCAIALLDTHAAGGMFGPKEEAYALVADWLQREVDRRVARRKLRGRDHRERCGTAVRAGSGGAP